MTNSFTNVFGGNPVFPALLSQQIFNFTGNTSLFWPTQFIDTPNTIADQNYISVNANGYNIALPDAILASNGMNSLIVNTSGSAHTFNITDFGGNFLATLSVGQAVVFSLYDNSTQNGIWKIFTNPGGSVGVSSVAATSSTNAIIIGGSPIVSAGTFTFAVAPSIDSLANLVTTGFLVQTVSGTLNARTLVGGSNIDVTNPAGILGNPVIDLSDTLTAMSSITVGNFNIANNTISTTGGNTNIHIIPNGTGSTSIGPGLNPPTFSSTGDLSNVDTVSVTTSAVIADISIVTNIISSTTGPLFVESTGTDSLTLKGASNTNPFVINQNNIIFHPQVPKCWVFFAGTTGTIQQSYNVTSVVRTGAGQYTVTIPGTLFGTVLIPKPNCYGASGFFINVQPTSLSTLTVSTRDNTNTLADPTGVYLEVSGS